MRRISVTNSSRRLDRVPNAASAKRPPFEVVVSVAVTIQDIEKMVRTEVHSFSVSFDPSLINLAFPKRGAETRTVQLHFTARRFRP